MEFLTLLVLVIGFGVLNEKLGGILAEQRAHNQRMRELLEKAPGDKGSPPQ